MGFVDFILNLAGLLLWLNWLSIRSDPLARPKANSLVGTLRKAGHSRANRWLFIAGLALLLALRAVFYWQVGPAVNWTPRVNLIAITLPFPLSYRGDFFLLMLLYSLLSFVAVLMGFYLWLLLLSFLGGRGGEADPFLRLARTHLGPVARWPWPTRLAAPLATGALLWLASSPLLAALHLVPPPQSWAHRLEQAVLLGLSTYLAWKYLVAGLLALHILNNYVYLGNHAFWNFVTLAAQSLLKPLRRFRLRVDKVDFAPLVGVAIARAVAHLAENGRDLPFTLLRIPSLADLFRSLPL
jgi:uncharacterized protein YggT (Ycf19 family)